jgi:hypothetical protein
VAQKGFFRKPECFEGLVATHGGKVIQEVAEPISCFKVISLALEHIDEFLGREAGLL